MTDQQNNLNQSEQVRIDPDQEKFRKLRIQPAFYALFALIVIFLLYQVIGGAITFLFFGTEITEEQSNQLRLFTLLGQVFLLFIPTLIFIRFQSKSILEFVRFKPIGLGEIFLITIGVIAAQIFLQGYLFFQDQIPLPEEVKPLVDELRRAIEHAYRVLVVVQSFPELLLVIFVVAIVPSFTEEFLFRGLVQRNFEYNFGFIGGPVVGGVIFGLYHLNPISLIPLIALGIIFGLLVYKTGSILSAIVAHFVNNAVAIISVYYRKEESLFSNGDDVSLSMIAAYMLLSLLIAVACWIALGNVVKNRRESNEMKTNISLKE